jgi:SNF2 family DNA or RNA helicase
MGLKSLLNSLLGNFSKEDLSGVGFEHSIDSSGINFYLDKAVFEELLLGRGAPTPLIQLVVLKMLEEQGISERLPNGFFLNSTAVSGLDDEQAELLQLPGCFNGQFTTNVRGLSKSSSFAVDINIIRDSQPIAFRTRGAILQITSSEQYRLTPAELVAFEAIEHHSQLTPDDKGEAANLRMIAELQMAQRSGMNIDLSHFEKFDVHIPDEIGVVATQLPDGSLELCPSLGDGSTPDQLTNRWGQLELSDNKGVLRVENRIVLIEPERMEGIKEVLGNRRIPADKVADFIATPSAFIDAALVNLDLGFSIRVLGVGKLKHIDFGTDDAKKADWFDAGNLPLPTQSIPNLVTTQEDLQTFTETVQNAQKQGASSVVFEGNTIDISDTKAVEAAIQETKKKLEQAKINPIDEPNIDVPNDKVAAAVVLKQLEESDASLLEKARNASSGATPDWNRYRRTPYPHQLEGIDWMTGLVETALQEDHSNPYRLQGALLADDMGLGKTFMTLVMLGEYIQTVKKTHQKNPKPMLVIAPLSLIENWEDEVSSTFKDIPFKDIVVLQSGRDLKEFRTKGAERESKQLADLLDEDEMFNESDIRYALNIGPEAGPHRLDVEGRLVLTTYQTLRDYQLSLCMIDWGVVVFDEAQNIKNPNTLQSRAAKGLKAEFKLLATGTPVENSLADFWCLMDTAQPGLLGGWAEYRENWIKPIANADEDSSAEVRATVGANLRKAVGPFMLRRVKEDQLDGLPTKSIHSGLPQPEDSTIILKPDLAKVMQGSQLQYYDSAIAQHRANSSGSDGKNQALRTLSLIRQISLHPRLSEEIKLLTADANAARSVMQESGKLSVLLDILDEIKAKKEKVILFMVTKSLQRVLKLWLDQIYGLNLSIINGDTAAVQTKSDELTRKGLITEFEAKEGFNILIMSPVAAGVGLTVVGANHVVHLERHWNPAKEAQATDRVYRIGQEKDVHIYLPAVTHPELDSFDVHLDRLLRGKIMLKDAVVTTEAVSEKAMLGSLGLE